MEFWCFFHRFWRNVYIKNAYPLPTFRQTPPPLVLQKGNKPTPHPPPPARFSDPLLFSDSRRRPRECERGPGGGEIRGKVGGGGEVGGRSEVTRKFPARFHPYSLCGPRAISLSLSLSLFLFCFCFRFRFQFCFRFRIFKIGWASKVKNRIL